MSSTEASDLVDSDDAPTPQQSRRFLLVGKDESTATGRVLAQGSSSTALKKRPTKEGNGGAASTSSLTKKRRLEHDVLLSSDVAGIRGVTGKGKNKSSGSCEKSPAVSSAYRGRRSLRGKKVKQADLSSSSRHDDSSSSSSNGGGGGGNHGDSDHDDHPHYSSGTPNSSSFRETGGRHGNKSSGGKARNSATAAGAASNSGMAVARKSTTANVARNRGATEESNQEDEYGATARSNRRARSGRLQARKAVAAAAGAGAGSEGGACATAVLLDSSSSGDDGDASYEASEEAWVDADADDRVEPVQTEGQNRGARRQRGAAFQTSNGKTRRSEAVRTKDSDKGDKPCRTPKSKREGRPVPLKNAPVTRSGKVVSRRRISAAAASSGDDDDCLRNSSSEGAASDGNGGVGDCGESTNEPVLCRCGAQHWKDGKRWIRCDGRGCWTWEHFRCAYPGAEGAKEEETEEDDLPAVHLCQRCKAKGSAGVVRSLARGDGISTAVEPSPKTAPSSVGGASKPREDVEAEGMLVRRSSRRVERRERIRPIFQRRKNVIGEAEPLSCSSEEDIGGADFGAVGEGGSDDMGGEFLAPEGKVEMFEEFRCRCGSTRKDERNRGDDNSDDGGDGGFSGEDGRWVQCRSDSCGVWEHAACCEYGCSSRGDRARGSSTQIENRRTRRLRHWCRGCDPTGKKHAKSEEKRRNREQLRAKHDGRGGGGGTARPTGEMSATRGLEAVRQRRPTAMVEKADVLRGCLWRAVASGDATLVGQIFREADGGKSGNEEHGNLVVYRLLEAEPPLVGDCSDLTIAFGGGGGRGGAMGSDSIGSQAFKFPRGGITLLMFAAGYWSLHCCVVAATSVSAVPASARMGGVEPVEDRGTPSPAGAAVSAEILAENPRFKAVQGSEARATTEEAQIHATTAGTEQNSGAPTTEPHVPAARETSEASESTVPDLGSESRLVVLREILGRGGDRAVLDVDGEGRTAAHHAAAAGAALEVALLLKGGAGGEAALARDHKGLAPLHAAAAANHPETCASILEVVRSSIPRAAVLTAKDGASGETAFHLACVEGHADCVKALLDEENKLKQDFEQEMSDDQIFSWPEKAPSPHWPLVLTKTWTGTTPLMAAAGCPSVQCVKLVLDRLCKHRFKTLNEKLEELRAQDDGGMNALHWAAGREAKGSVEAATAVIAAERSIARLRFPPHRNRSGGNGWDERAMISTGDAENGASPLHLAAAVSHKDMVSLLLKEGANSVLLDGQGWTPVMYADFGGRKEGAVLELLRHEPEKQLEALGNVLSSRNARNHPRVVEVVRNLATVPAFFSLVNGFVRKNQGLLLTTLSFLREEPGLLDFENKRNLLRTLLKTPDFVTQAAFDMAARPPESGFGYTYHDRINTRRVPGEGLGALLVWMEDCTRRWGEGGLAAWLRIRQPTFHFEGEAGYGPGVDREAWDLIAEDLVLAPSASPAKSQKTPAASSVPPAAAAAGSTPTPIPAGTTASTGGSTGGGAGAAVRLSPTATSDLTREDTAADTGASGVGPSSSSPPPPPPPPPSSVQSDKVGEEEELEALFVPVDGGVSSYCPRDLRGMAGKGGENWREKKEKDLRAFELLGMVIGANLGWNKVLNLNLNPVVWKTILSRKVHLADLDLVDEMYYRSMKQVLEMDGADELGLSFGCLELKFCRNGDGFGPDDDVTDDNKEQYAALALESRTFGRWRAQARALSHGLRRLVPLCLLKMFTENELGLLMAGPGEIDLNDWRRHAVFSGGASTQIQGWFWSLVESLTKEERSLLLQFATGCSRLPAGGFSGLSRPFTIAMLEYDTRRPLPMAATCFFMLKLPRYPDQYSLRKYMLVAIRHGAAGFEFS